MLATREIDPMVPQVARVVASRRELGDVWTLDIDAGPRGFTFQPGQFNMLYAFGVGEAAISISGDPGKTERLVHTIRSVGKVSDALARLNVGDTIGVRGPFGGGWPVAGVEGSDVVVVAGGLGLAPLRPTLYHLLANRDRYGRIVLLCGARSPNDILYRHELEAWRERLDIDIDVSVDHADPAWHGNVGVVTTLVPRAAFDPARTIAMICGPEIMMRFVVRALAGRGLDGARTHVSLERNMQCGVALCGHCQLGPLLLCRDGPVLAHDRVAALLDVREL